MGCNKHKHSLTQLAYFSFSPLPLLSQLKSLVCRKRAPKLAEGYFAWMSPVWNCPDTELVEKIGLDAVVFIRFIRMCRQIFIALAVLGCGTLIPINIIGTIRSQDGVVPEDKIGLLTISGIKNFDWLWAHVGAIWAFSTVFGLAILHGYRSFLRFRIQYFESDAYQESMASRTLMLAGLPDTLQDDDKLSTFMSNLGTTDQPVQAVVGRKVNKLPELMAEHKKMVTSLEKIMVKYFAGKAPLFSLYVQSENSFFFVTYIFLNDVLVSVVHGQT